MSSLQKYNASWILSSKAKGKNNQGFSCPMYCNIILFFINHLLVQIFFQSKSCHNLWIWSIYNKSDSLAFNVAIHHNISFPSYFRQHNTTIVITMIISPHMLVPWCSMYMFHSICSVRPSPSTTQVPTDFFI